VIKLELNGYSDIFLPMKIGFKSMSIYSWDLFSILNPDFQTYWIPEGRILLGGGRGLSYYECRYPMGDRLIGENWRGLLV